MRNLLMYARWYKIFVINHAHYSFEFSFLVLDMFAALDVFENEQFFGDVIFSITSRFWLPTLHHACKSIPNDIHWNGP